MTNQELPQSTRTSTEQRAIGAHWPSRRMRLQDLPGWPNVRRPLPIDWRQMTVAEFHWKLDFDVFVKTQGHPTGASITNGQRFGRKVVQQYVYFIADAQGDIKIGTTKNLRSRIRALATAMARSAELLCVVAG